MRSSSSRSAAICRSIRSASSREPEGTERERFKSLPYPVGILRGGALPDIDIYFVHYSSFAEAKEKWMSRFQRVNYDNLYILMDRGMDARDEILDGFHSLPYAHKVFFTHKEDPARWPSVFRFSFYTRERFQEGYLYQRIRHGLLEYRALDEFDYVQWLNDGTIQKNPHFPWKNHLECNVNDRVSVSTDGQQC